MFQLLSKTIGLAPLIFCLSCSFANLNLIGISTVPDGPWTLLADEESPVIIHFDTEMDRRSVEKAIQVYSPNETISGDYRWENTSLFFEPSAPWKPGIRYGLRLAGTVIALDGRELVLSSDIPFYAVSHSFLPYLESFSPLDQSSVGVSEAKILELVFSHPMDSQSTENALRLDIPGKKIFEWTNDKTLTISSDKPLNPWTVYRWSISEKAKSAEGAPLAKEFSGRFISDLDREFISVLRLIPLMKGEAETSVLSHALWGTWIPAAINLERGPGPKQGIGVEFNKPIESDSLRRAFSFTPSLPGRVEILSPVSAVFIPTRDPEPETLYSMRISGSVRDSEGLKMGEDFAASFRADIPFLSIDSVSFGFGEKKTISGDLLKLKLAPNEIIHAIIHFSLPFDSLSHNARQDAAFRISLRPFFPETLTSLNLRSAKWISSDSIMMEWEGAEAGKEDGKHYYKLVVPGTSNGVHNGLGSYLKEDFILYLEAEA